MKKVAGILTGCGVFDGSEIQEAVCTLLALARNQIAVQWFAPDEKQHDLVDHTQRSTPEESRNQLTEAARIVRGEIKPLSDLKITEFQGLVFPGGFGVAKNLCTFAFDGAAMSVHAQVEAAVLEMHRQHGALGFICIAPVIAAKVLGKAGRYPMLTLGNNPELAGIVESWGATHQVCEADEICVDKGNRLVTVPAWNSAVSPLQVEQGINRLVESLAAMM